jgi:hypothetical protein
MKSLCLPLSAVFCFTVNYAEQSESPVSTHFIEQLLVTKLLENAKRFGFDNPRENIVSAEYVFDLAQEDASISATVSPDSVTLISTIKVEKEVYNDPEEKSAQDIFQVLNITNDNPMVNVSAKKFEPIDNLIALSSELPSLITTQEGTPYKQYIENVFNELLESIEKDSIFEGKKQNAHLFSLKQSINRLKNFMQNPGDYTDTDFTFLFSTELTHSIKEVGHLLVPDSPKISFFGVSLSPREAHAAIEGAAQGFETVANAYLGLSKDNPYIYSSLISQKNKLLKGLPALFGETVDENSSNFSQLPIVKKIIKSYLTLYIGAHYEEYIEKRKNTASYNIIKQLQSKKEEDAAACDIKTKAPLRQVSEYTFCTEPKFGNNDEGCFTCTTKLPRELFEQWAQKNN